MKFKFYALKLSGIMILIFIAQTLFLNFTEFFILNELSFVQLWRFLTAIFLHGSLVHLIFNLFALFLFGSTLESLIGGKRFLLIFFSTGVLANFVGVNFYDSSLGASGAIFGIIGALVLIRPMLVIFAFGMPMPIFIAGILWMIGDILGTIGFLTGNPIDSTGNIAHLSGMFFGLIFGYLLRKKFVKERRKNVSIDENEIRIWEDTYMKG